MCCFTSSGGVRLFGFATSGGKAVTGNILSPQQIALSGSTRLISGGTVSEATTTSAQVLAGVGDFIDSYTDPENPTGVRISWSTQIVALTNILTDPATILAVNSSGVVTQFTSIDAPNFRDHVFVGFAVHAGQTVIESVSTNPLMSPTDPSLAVRDLAAAVGAINRRGNMASANGVNLTINKSSGIIGANGANWFISRKDPFFRALGSLTAPILVYTWRNGSGGFNFGVGGGAGFNEIVPGAFDDGTVSTTSPNGVVANNRWSIHTIYVAVENTIVVHYGQQDFATREDAQAEVLHRDFETNPLITDLGTLVAVAFIIVRGAGTDLSIIGDAKFLRATRFGI